MDTFKPKYEEAVRGVCVREWETQGEGNKGQRKPRGHSYIKEKLKQLEESRRKYVW